MKFVVLLLALGLIFAAPCWGQDTQKSSETAKYKIDIDYSATPELKDWAETQLRPAVEKWYPIIVADLPSEGFTPPQHFDIKIDPNYKGVAATSGTHVMVSPIWITSQSARGPVNESVGSVIHELVHVVQQYGHGRGGSRIPGYFTEGIADYIRWWKYEPASVRRVIRPTKRNGEATSYRDSYSTTAAFLEYVAKNYDHEFVVKLNAAGRDGRYSPDIFTEYTGKSVDELWTEFAGTLSK